LHYITSAEAADVAKLLLLNKCRVTHILPCGVYGGTTTLPVTLTLPKP